RPVAEGDLTPAALTAPSPQTRCALDAPRERWFASSSGGAHGAVSPPGGAMIVETRELSPVRLKDAKDGTFLSFRRVSAAVALDGPFARTPLTVTFHNDLDRPLEGDLVFPLPPSAALRELSATVGKRTLAGKIRPRERAQAEYTRAVQAG